MQFDCNLTCDFYYAEFESSTFEKINRRQNNKFSGNSCISESFLFTKSTVGGMLIKQLEHLFSTGTVLCVLIRLCYGDITGGMVG